ncbi:MAG TPA: hypothetical protein VL332_06695 [Candidatus Saccharimonadaceae bacterium]|jgi:hypothetical protein|nr:hypothetical protein [Candidatus Saccharimonadaceae bacterium]
MRRVFAALALGLGLGAGAAHATPPAPLDPVRFSFPGSMPMPGSATSAGLALADRWLGTEPFDNPAWAPRRAGSVAPLLLHSNRQDLRAANRDFSDETAYVDFAGAWAGTSLGRVGLAAYLQQPVLRLEDNAYTVGNALSPTSGSVVSSTSARELRAGVLGSLPLGRVRAGVALEWTHRDDVYQADVEDGSPNSGTTRLELSGSGVGGSAGLRFDGQFLGRALGAGAAWRYVPELSLDVTQRADLISGSSTASMPSTRAAGWEGGASVRWLVDPAFALLAGGGARGAQDWSGLGVTTGAGSSWALAGEYHDARDPWTLRFGGGAEQQSGVPEARDGVYGLGFGWLFGTVAAEVGLTHRVIERAAAPHSYEERIVATLRWH